MTAKPFSTAESLFWARLAEAGLPMPESEVRILPPRKWRVDFCWAEYELVVEIDGGGWVGGRHHRPVGYDADAEKLNAIASAGWCIFRFTPKMIRSGLAIKTVEEYFERWHKLGNLEQRNDVESIDWSGAKYE